MSVCTCTAAVKRIVPVLKSLRQGKWAAKRCQPEGPDCPEHGACVGLQGWSWVEEGWVVDTQGIADDAVDVDGWSYATDFGWLHMPPAAGSGKFRKVKLNI